MMRRLVRLVVATGLVGSVTLAVATPASAALPTINGGGSSFAKLEIDQWRAEVARDPFNIKVNYIGQGSSYGRQQYINGSFDFAASDIPFQPSELNALSGDRASYAYVPVSAGGLGFMYNLTDLNGKRVTTLKLRRRTVCRMFSEPNIKWDDAEIAEVNPDLRLPSELVRPIVRQDGSGTSYVFSEFCIAVAPDVWSAFVAHAGRVSSDLDQAFTEGKPTSVWPRAFGADGAGLAADGVAAIVADSNGRNSITYNEAGFAKVRGFPNASLENESGQFLQPTEAAVSIALAYAKGRGDGTFELEHKANDPKAYFPSTYSYIIVPTKGIGTDKGEALARFLCYSVTKGQRLELTDKLGYARLSDVLVGIARDSIAKIPGAPAWDQCKVESAAPPTASTVASTTPTTKAPSTATTKAGSTGGATGSSSGGTTGGATAGGSTAGGSSGGSTGAASPVAGGAGSSPESGITGDTVLDPVTGEFVPADNVGEVLDQSGGAPSAGRTSGVVKVDPNPTVSAKGGGPSTGEILWVLAQGAAVCGFGVALAGSRRRLGTT